MPFRDHNLLSHFLKHARRGALGAALAGNCTGTLDLLSPTSLAPVANVSIVLAYNLM